LDDDDDDNLQKIDGRSRFNYLRHFSCREAIFPTVCLSVLLVCLCSG